MVSRPNGCRVGATACGLAFLVAACGDSDPSGPELIDLAGTYDYEFNVSNASGQLICDGEGVVTMSQTAEEFFGTYEGWARCYTPGAGGIIHEGAGQITAGVGARLRRRRSLVSLPAE